jgi:outer membrane receptor for ferrienterochelin and colicin
MAPNRNRERRQHRRSALLAVCALFLAAPALAGTTGILSGRVTDAARQPLPGVTVQVPDARLGAMTDEQGRFRILNVPAGPHDVTFQLLGYRRVVVQAVPVSADQTAVVDAQMQETTVTTEEVVVSGRRPVVETNLTSNLATVTREEIAQLPVQDLEDVVNLQAGVVDGHFRGGRLGEVQYQVDGISINDAYSNTPTLRLDRSLLEEVQVISGTFDAEYGQAMSGVVNAILRRGTDKFEAQVEAFIGDFFTSDEDTRDAPDDFLPLGIQNYQGSVSGPIRPLPQTTFLVSARRFAGDDFVTGTRTFLPTDRNDVAKNEFDPNGNGERAALVYSDEWSGVGKISNRSIDNAEISYQAVVNSIEGQRASWAFRLLPDAATQQKTFSITHGLDWTHTLSANTYYTFAVRQNYFDYQDRVYDDIYDPRYDAAGPLLSDADYEEGAWIQGVDFTHFEQKTNALLFKSAFTSQMAREHLVKGGAEVQWPWMTFGTTGEIVATSGDSVMLTRFPKDPQKFHPFQAAGFAQDDIEWEGLNLRAGLRFDLFDARWWIPSDLSNPANSIDGAPQSEPQPTTAKVSLSPRLGVSYPVTKDAAVSFAYGHFSQMPALGTAFSNLDYTVLEDLQAGGISYGVIGNPDIAPERTVQYQVGYKQALEDWLGLDVTAFYKDIRDLLGVEFITTYNEAEYARLTNVDFGSVIGATIALDQRQRGLLSTTLDYTWQQAQGNASDPRETATRASVGEVPRPRQVPFSWDQTHTLNATVTLSRPEDFVVSGIFRLASGQPYTPVQETGFGLGLETHSGRKPLSTLLDLRAEKVLDVSGNRMSIFGRLFNVFDTRFFNGFVFPSTGSVEYSRFPESDQILLDDPYRFYSPRRLELGVTMAWKS